jgi:hypothetical protein
VENCSPASNRALGMRRVTYQDDKGRKWDVWLPDGAPDTDAPLGVPIGPPDLSELDLPEHVLLRLHTELYAREIFTANDALKGIAAINAALQASFRVDSQRVQAVYINQLKQSDDSS